VYRHTWPASKAGDRMIFAKTAKKIQSPQSKSVSRPYVLSLSHLPCQSSSVIQALVRGRSLRGPAEKSSWKTCILPYLNEEEQPAR